MTQKISINLLYFAFIKDITRSRNELIKLPYGTSVEKLLEILLAKYPKLSDAIDTIRISINYKVVGLDAILKEGDEVALLPPISGG